MNLKQSGQFNQQTQNTIIQQKDLQIAQLNAQIISLQQQFTIQENQLKLHQQQDSLNQQKIQNYEKLLKDQSNEVTRLNQLLQTQTGQISQNGKELEAILIQKDQCIAKLEEDARVQKKEISHYKQIINQFKLFYSDIKQRKPQIKGLVQQLMSSEYKIYNWKKNPQIKIEYTEFEIFEVKSGKHMNKVLDHKFYFLASKELQVESIGKIKAASSVKPYVEGDLQVGYMIEIQSADDQSLQNKFLLRREPKQFVLSQGYKKKNDAAFESINNILFQALLERFQKGEERFELYKDFKIQRQFVLKPVDLQIYYYCEMIEEGEFQKINGGDMQPIINSDFEDYYNFFTFNSFTEQNEELVVSHLQRVGNHFHDMIISTLTGVYTRYDQGKQEVIQTIKNLERALGFVSQTIQ